MIQSFRQFSPLVPRLQIMITRRYRYWSWSGTAGKTSRYRHTPHCTARECCDLVPPRWDSGGDSAEAAGPVRNAGRCFLSAGNRSQVEQEVRGGRARQGGAGRIQTLHCCNTGGNVGNQMTALLMIWSYWKDRREDGVRVVQRGQEEVAGSSEY